MAEEEKDNKPSSFCVVDVETTIKNTIGKNKASAFNKDNWLCLVGVHYPHNSCSKIGSYSKRFEESVRKLNIGSTRTKLKVLVGHNIKFDLHWLRRYETTISDIPLRDWLGENTLWDTQAAEYIISGQSHRYPSLDECSKKYGGTLKDDRIKTMWEAGVQTEDMPEEMLAEYLEGDVENTALVMVEQAQIISSMGLMPLTRNMMDAISAYHEMEWNGMCIDIHALQEYGDKERKRLAEIDEKIYKLLPPDVRDIADVNSGQQLSALLFGGEIKYKVREKIGKYKNGKDKYKNVEKKLIDPFAQLSILEDDWETKKPGVYKTSDDVLSALVASLSPGSYIYHFIQLIQERRKITKEISSYYDSIPKILFGEFIHQNINNCSTGTGRLSQDNPNMQNVSTGSTSNVKKIFVSRWGSDGVIIEADYKQLEIIALAFLSGDTQLRDDLIHGRDMHNETLKKVAHLLPSHLSDKEKRRVVKSINFGLVYGGGAKTLGKQAGVPTHVAKAVLDAFFDRYPGVKIWQQSVYDEVTRSRKGTGTKTKAGMPRGRGEFVSITGRRYTFFEYDAPDWVKRYKKIDTSFSPTETNNYPVQGFATADIVPTMVAKMFKALINSELKDDCLMINTVHDSIVFDCKRESVHGAAELIKEVLESAPTVLKEDYGIDFDLPLKVDITYGLNWKDQNYEYDPDIGIFTYIDPR